MKLPTRWLRAVFGEHCGTVLAGLLLVAAFPAHAQTIPAQALASPARDLRNPGFPNQQNFPADACYVPAIYGSTAAEAGQRYMAAHNAVTGSTCGQLCTNPGTFISANEQSKMFTIQSNCTGNTQDIQLAVVTHPKSNPRSECCEGNPVDVATGGKYETEIDYQSAGADKLLFARYYNSNTLDTTGSPLSPGWRTNYSKRVYAAGSAVAVVRRETGQIFTFTKVGSSWGTDPDVPAALEEVAGGGWIYRDSANVTEVYDPVGRLSNITGTEGLTTTVSYDGDSKSPHLVTNAAGRTLVFEYDTAGRLHRMVDPAGEEYIYTYVDGNLDTVSYPDDDEEVETTRKYHYEETGYPHALTGITDENQARFATWDYDNSGRVILSKHAGDVEKTMFVYNTNGTVVVTDALQAERTYTLGLDHGVLKAVAISGDKCASCGGRAAAYSYDVNGYTDARTDFNGRVTTSIPNARGLEGSRTEALGTDVERTITTQWHPTFRLPTQVDESGRTTTYGYDVKGRRHTQTVTDTALGGQSRTTTWTYTQAGQGVPEGLLDTIDGPRTDVSDVTDFDYDAAGNLIRTTNALGHVTDVTSRDAHGNPLTIRDSNYVTTTLTYDKRLRLKTRTVAGDETKFGYTPAGQLDRVTLPDLSFLDYDYDDAQRLTDVRDNLGNHIKYTLDGLGNRKIEETRDPGLNLKRKIMREFDELGRLWKLKNASDVLVTEYGYDDEGNRTSQIDHVRPGESVTTAFVPDELNRVERVTDHLDGEAVYVYNDLDQLESVTDQRGLTTGYLVNAHGDIKELNSPDTGTTGYPLHDGAGNRLRQVDARGIQVDYQYDALNRLIKVDYPGTTEDVTYVYDSAFFGQTFVIGRLAWIVDQAGLTTIHYDERGNVVREARTTGGTTYATLYTYDDADRVGSITYPSGRVVTYMRDPLGNIDRVTTTVGGGAPTDVAYNVEHTAFGGVASYTLGNGVSVVRSRDLDYRIDRITDQGVQDVQVQYTLRNDIERIQDNLNAARTTDYGYDALSRLAAAARQDTLHEYGYDALGNRTSERFVEYGWIGNETFDSYIYPPTSNRLLHTTSLFMGLAHDAAGNVTNRSGLTLTYNFANRAATVGPVSNTYNAAGQRVAKSANGATTMFHYDRQGRLLSELITPGPLVQREYIWLEDLPLAIETFAEPIVDNTDGAFTTTGAWTTATTPAGYYGTNYRKNVVTSIDRDDGGPWTSKTGTWTIVDSTAAYESGYQKSCSTSGPTYTWTSPPLSGDYKVYARWVSFSGVSTNVRYTVTHVGGSTAHTRNQSTGSGSWSLLGTHTFNAAAQVTLSRISSGCLSADAVRFEPVNPTDAAQWAPPGTAEYSVYAWWPASAAHSPSAVYRITHATGTQDFSRNQQTGGGAWSALGTFTFTSAAGQGVKLLASASGAVAADAVRFKPTAWSTHQRALYYYHVDHLGTPRKLTDATQQIAWNADYDAFGAASLVTSSVTQPLRFPGQYFDAETGLHQNHHRDYDPSTGRYLQSDPIGLGGGVSTYGYAQQNPLRYTDPLGLAPAPICPNPRECVNPPIDPTPDGPKPSPQPKPGTKGPPLGYSCVDVSPDHGSCLSCCAARSPVQYMREPGSECQVKCNDAWGMSRRDDSNSVCMKP